MRHAARSVGASLMVPLLLAAFSGSAAAHDERCALDLREAPIEDVPPLPGWTLSEVEIAADGWRGRMEWSGGDLRAASFAISCVVDPAGLLERRAEVRRSALDEDIKIERVIGDEVAAWRDSRTATTHLEWRSGPVIGEMVGEWNASVAELAAMAPGIEPWPSHPACPTGRGVDRRNSCTTVPGPSPHTAQPVLGSQLELRTRVLHR